MFLFFLFRILFSKTDFKYTFNLIGILSENYLFIYLLSVIQFKCDIKF